MADESDQQKLAKTCSPAPVCLKGCFPSSVVHGGVSDEDDEAREARTPRSPYAWLKSTSEIPEIRFRCRSLMARLGRDGGRRMYNSSDFSYDPASYALNFDTGDESFSVRLPLSPKPSAAGREIAGFS